LYSSRNCQSAQTGVYAAAFIIFLDALQAGGKNVNYWAENSSPSWTTQRTYRPLMLCGRVQAVPNKSDFDADCSFQGNAEQFGP